MLLIPKHSNAQDTSAAALDQSAPSLAVIETGEAEAQASPAVKPPSLVVSETGEADAEATILSEQDREPPQCHPLQSHPIILKKKTSIISNPSQSYAFHNIPIHRTQLLHG
jgi:hypothetical protein